MSPTALCPGRSLASCWPWGARPRRLLLTVPISGPVKLLLLLLASALLPSARPASREEEVVFPEKLNGSVLPGSGVPARLLYRLPAFGDTLLLELEQDPGVRVEGLTVQYLGQAPELLGGAEPGTYLTGTINGDPESVASLHWDGAALLGVLQYRGAELHIQPLEGGAPNSAAGPGAHVLRRKSPASGQGPMCSVKAPSGSPSPSPRRAKVGVPHGVWATDLSYLLHPRPRLLPAWPPLATTHSEEGSQSRLGGSAVAGHSLSPPSPCLASAPYCHCPRPQRSLTDLDLILSCTPNLIFTTPPPMPQQLQEGGLRP